ncbi:MAG: hypothetical protein J0H08_09950 [Rhizobiales bacterium]|nr:hypothetical protein [Hyphomicrobiales bacterium]
MLLGILLTLSSVAVATTLARGSMEHLIERHGRSVDRVARGLDAISGLLLIAIGLRALVR